MFMKIVGMKHFKNMLMNPLAQRYSFKVPVLIGLLRKNFSKSVLLKKEDQEAA